MASNADLTTCIVLGKLDENKMKTVLNFCNTEDISYSVEPDYYPKEDFNILGMLDNMVKSWIRIKKPIGIEFQPLVENQYIQFLDEIRDETMLSKLNNENIDYV